MDKLNYYQARILIATGDLIAFRQRGGLLHWLISRVTRSPYTHTAIAVWAGPDALAHQPTVFVRPNAARRLLVAEAKASGVMLTPLSQYASVDFDVYPCPRQAKARVEPMLWRTIGHKTPYDVLDLLRIAAHRLFKRPLPVRDDARRICSALSAEIWQRAGWRAQAPMPTIPAPDDIVAAHGGAPILCVRAAK